MEAIETLTETQVTLKLTANARARPLEQAAVRGEDMSALASMLIEQLVSRPTIDEILAPFRKQVEESGMTDQELDDFLADVYASRRAGAE